jgi:Flp pilus assembly protein TadG
MTTRRCRGDAGQVGGIEVLPFGFLLFISATLLFVNVWGVIDAKFAVTAAAREASRAFVEADSESAAVEAATRRGNETLDAYGRGGERATVGTPVLSQPFGRCVRVTITVAYEVPVIAIPFLGGLGSLSPVRSTSTGIVDPFRSGLDGVTSC